jgi:hypothetical protein
MECLVPSLQRSLVAWAWIVKVLPDVICWGWKGRRKSITPLSAVVSSLSDSRDKVK